MHRKMSRLLLLCAGLLALFSVPVFSQDSANAIGHVSIASPNAASLGKFGDIPVSYHTGIPQIGIPIYTIKAGPLSLPINLSYHASGLKVQEPAGWVGAGWALDAGGVITRTVMGQPDERGTNAGGAEVKGHFSDYGYNNYLYGIDGKQDWIGFAEGRKDGQPDLFFFNFGGYTGKFYFRDDRTPVLVPQQDLKIVPYYPSDSTGYIVTGPGGGSIQGFTVTTPDGVQYFFGNTPGTTGTLPIEVTNPFTLLSGTGGTAISSWYLNKIVSPDNQFSIQLGYQPETYGYFTLSTFPVSGTTVPNEIGAHFEYDLVKNIVTGVRLSKISFPNGTVNFIGGSVRTDLSDNIASISDGVNQQCKTLGAIQITDSAGFCKRYNFSYGYFTDNSTPLSGFLLSANYNLQTDKQRLRLDSVTEVSCDNSVNVPPHKFSYFTEMVPRRLAFGFDHWGFYNGVPNNNKLVPSYTVNGVPFPGANRSSAWPAMRGGALQQISYPTGGHTVFDFEPHNFIGDSSGLTDNILAGMVVHMFGQSQDTMINNFVGNGNAITISLTSTANYSGSLSIINTSTNATVYYLNVPTYAVSPTSYNLPAGNYKAVLTLPNYNNLSGGATANISQKIDVTFTYNIVIGGLRIKTITHNDGLTTKDQVTSYDYTSGGSPTGVLYSVPVYVQQVRNDLIENVGFWTVANGFQPNSLNPYGCPGNGGEFCISAGSIRPMATAQGNHFGYSLVKVSQSGNGYSNYNYYIHTNGYPTQSSFIAVTDVNTTSCNPNAPNYPAAPPPLDYRRGELYYEQHFNEAGQLLKDAYYYPYYDTTTVLTTPGFIVSMYSGGGQNILLGTNYNLSTVRKTKMMVISDDYKSTGSGGLSKTTTTYYGSPYHNQPTRKVTTTSTGDSLSTNMKYAFDFRLPNCDATTNCGQSYTTTCSSCQTQYNNARTACGGGGLCLTTAYLAYLQCQASARISYDSCQRLNYINPTNAFSTCHINAATSADGYLKPVLRLQDQYNNALIESSDWKNQNLRHADFTKYDTSLIPIGYAYPGKTQLLMLQAPSSTFANAAVSGSTVTRDNRYADESSYLFNKGNPLQVTPHDGVPVAYVWDYLNTQPIAKVANTTSDQIAYTSFEGDGSGNWTIGSVLRNATAVTGKRSYTLSNGGISKAGLTAAQIYVVSYWTTNGSAYMITGTQSGYPIQGRTSVVKGTSWTYFEHRITGQTSVSLTGSGSIDEIRLYPLTAQMISYSYSPLIGMISQCDVTNRITYYEYDSLARLLRIRDMDNNILKQYEYQYQKPAIYLSAAQSGSFTRSNCATGAIPSNVLYTVAAGGYTSAISQADADAKALAMVNLNGPAYANSNGTCTFYNTAQSGNFTRTNCATGGSPSTVTYTIAAGAYNSLVDQPTANQLAANALAAGGPAFANSNGTCTFYNTVQGGSYTRNNCGTGGVGSSITYTVPANTYSSLITQGDADQKALTAANTTGQANANASGTCTFYNQVQSGTYTRNNCSCQYTGSAVLYTVPANTYSSSVDLATANQQATNAVTANGQTYANTNGTCTTTCTGTNHKIISCACQTGSLGIISQVYTAGIGCVTKYGYFFSDGSYIYDHTSTFGGQCP
ncbi:DUF5977 domain-containing protein [Flavitalea flava]